VDDLLNTAQAARRLRVSVRRVQAMIRSGLLRATKLGRDWVIRGSDLEALRRRERPPGRPRAKP
jgi:excisionase family DNA binding protein